MLPQKLMMLLQMPLSSVQRAARWASQVASEHGASLAHSCITRHALIRSEHCGGGTGGGVMGTGVGAYVGTLTISSQYEAMNWQRITSA